MRLLKNISVESVRDVRTAASVSFFGINNAMADIRQVSPCLRASVVDRILKLQNELMQELKEIEDEANTRRGGAF